MDDLSERVRELEITLAVNKARQETGLFWGKIFVFLVLAWLGITSLITLPNLVNRTAEGQAAQRIFDLRDAAEENLKKIETATEAAETVSPIQWVRLNQLAIDERNSGSLDEAAFCIFDRLELDQALDGWTEWHDRRVLVANPETGNLSIGMIFRHGDDEADGLSAHLRFGATLPDATVDPYPIFEPKPDSDSADRRSNWLMAESCIIGIAVPETNN